MEDDDDIQLFVQSKKQKIQKTSDQSSLPLSAAVRVEPVEVVKEKEHNETVSWSDLKLCKWIQNSCKQHGLSYPTPIQQQCITPLLEGKRNAQLHLIECSFLRKRRDSQCPNR
jgi:hypothetical protein